MITLKKEFGVHISYGKIWVSSKFYLFGKEKSSLLPSIYTCIASGHSCNRVLLLNINIMCYLIFFCRVIPPKL